MTAQWQDQADCAGTDGWELDGLGQDAAAALAAELRRSFCNSCPVTTQCLADAYDKGAYDTVRGGVAFDSEGREVVPNKCRGGCGADVPRVWCTACRPKSHGRRLGLREIVHGSTGGARAHYRRGEKACQTCRDAAAAAVAARKRAAA